MILVRNGLSHVRACTSFRIVLSRAVFYLDNPSSRYPKPTSVCIRFPGIRTVPGNNLIMFCHFFLLLFLS